MNRLQCLRSFIFRQRVWISCIVVAFLLLVLPTPHAASAEPRHVTINASQFEFAPGRIEVNYGDHIVITLTSSDVVHGFYLDGYGVEQRVVPGISKQIEFIANQAGKFHFRCLVSCGTMHPFMIGELVVSPNLPLFQAVGLIAIALFGTFFHLWNIKGVHNV